MQIKDFWQKAQDWWTNLVLREKRAVMIGGAALLIFIAYAGIWSPLMNHVADLRKRIVTEQKDLVWMQAADQSLQKMTAEMHEREKAIPPVALLSLMQKNTDSAGLSPYMTQLKQSSNDAIVMQFKKVEFDKLLAMLIKVSKEKPVSIEQLSVQAETPGFVDADIILRSG